MSMIAAEMGSLLMLMASFLAAVALTSLIHNIITYRFRMRFFNHVWKRIKRDLKF